MGKSETMKALADATDGVFITADQAIVEGLSNSTHRGPIFIDALDEARVSADSSIWRELRRQIAQARPGRLGLACRVADWHSTDVDQLAAAAGKHRVRVFELNPLTQPQRAALLHAFGNPDPSAFEQQAQLLGFEDMLGNPQSLRMLSDAVKGNAGRFPNTRRDAYELACQELLKEPNIHHRQAAKNESQLSSEVLLDAAGWLCALLLLSNRNEVTEDEPDSPTKNTVVLRTASDTLNGTGIPPSAVSAALKLRIFKRPGGYVPVHRTVAEFLAARYIARRVQVNGLLPQRVSALMVADGKHLISNLRGLAGWLAVLSEPLRQQIFEVDPWAVLDYGDLHLLSPAEKASLIDQLEKVPTTQSAGGRWQRASLHTPLVRSDMFEVVSERLCRLGQQSASSSEANEVADVLLGALAQAPKSAKWLPMLFSMVRNTSLSEGLRVEALRALYQHIDKDDSLLPLLQELHATRSLFANKRLCDDLLIRLYPDTLPPSRVMPYLDSSRREGNRISINWFWDHHIQKQTPNDRLMELMDAIEVALSQPSFKELRRWKGVYQLNGLRTLLLRAIQLLGAKVSTEKLTNWLTWCMDIEDGLLRFTEPSDRTQLKRWLDDNPALVLPVLANMVAKGASSWVAQHNLMVTDRPGNYGRFWLDEALHWDSQGDAAKAIDCLQTATWWLTERGGGGLSLQDLEDSTEGRPTLQAALSTMLVSSLDTRNWQRERWLDDRKDAARAARRDALNQGNLRFLLDHLEDVRSAKLLNYLGQAAMYEARQFGSDGKLLEDWRSQHPALDEATREGYLTLLLGLTAEKTKKVVEAHASSQISYIELPCLLAADKLHRETPHQFFELGTERLEALLTICLLNYGEPPTWFMEFAATRSNELVATWLKLTKATFRANPIRIPQLGWLTGNASLHPVARTLLPEFLSRWPSKFTETSFPEFAQLLEACLRQLSADHLISILNRRLQRKALGALQTAYLVMAGVWISPGTFTARLQQLLATKQIQQADLLGFVAHLTRHSGRESELPAWGPATLELLFLLLAPLCPAAYPNGAHWVGNKDHGRDFLHRVLSQLQNDPSSEAQRSLANLLQAPTLYEWHPALQAASLRQMLSQAESAFELPSPRQVALTLQNKTPSNPADLMAVALDTLGGLQKTLRNSDTNRLNRLWSVESAGKRPIPPHRPEPECRNAIADWLRADLAAMDISVTVEHQHGGQNQSDIVLKVTTPAHEDMLLPIEVKGDWNRDLWTAAAEQLAKQYASESRCHGQGIYLVLWLGGNRGKAAKPKPHPNHPTHTSADLQVLLQKEAIQNTLGQNIRVVVLDISIPA
jgi:hypothetical protein